MFAALVTLAVLGYMYHWVFKDRSKGKSDD